MGTKHEEVTRCVDCGCNVNTQSCFFGAGDGTGNKFRCGACHWYREGLALAARVRELETALREGLDHMHPITCASMDGYEDSGKPCDCWHSRAEAALAPTQRDA